MRKIQELMGHKDIKMTVRYTHLSQPDLLAAVEQLAGSGKVFEAESAAVVSGGPTATRTATSEFQPLEDSATIVN